MKRILYFGITGQPFIVKPDSKRNPRKTSGYICPEDAVEASSLIVGEEGTVTREDGKSWRFEVGRNNITNEIQARLTD